MQGSPLLSDDGHVGVQVAVTGPKSEVFAAQQTPELQSALWVHLSTLSPGGHATDEQANVTGAAATQHTWPGAQRLPPHRMLGPSVAPSGTRASSGGAD
jgi:hypothetical protein